MKKTRITPLVLVALIITLVPTMGLAEEARDWLIKGNDYLEEGNHEKAMECCNEAISIDPNYADAYFIRGLVYTDIGAYEEAIKDFSKAIDLEPNDDHAYLRRGTAYYKLGRYHEALEDYRTSCDMGYEEGCEAYETLSEEMK